MKEQIHMSLSKTYDIEIPYDKQHLKKISSDLRTTLGIIRKRISGINDKTMRSEYIWSLLMNIIIDTGITNENKDSFMRSMGRLYDDCNGQIDNRIDV